MENQDRTFSRLERMKSDKEIARLFEQGKGGFVYPVRYVFHSEREPAQDRDEKSPVRVLVSVPKRNHKRAVERNLLKRRLREAYRQNKQPLRAGDGHRSLGLIYASGDVVSYEQIENAVRKIVGILSAPRV